MAKASLYLKCKKCGKEFCHEKYFSNSKERNSYEEWARDAIDLCPDCYKAESREKMREENKKVGLILNASVVPGINLQNGEILMYLWFSGDTETHKEEIKSLGYHWDECKNADRYYSLSLKREMCWGKRIEAKDFEEEIKKAEEIGAKKFVPDAGLFGSIHAQVAAKKHQEWLEIQEELKKLEKPQMPDFLKEMIGDKPWNQKVYGKSSGRYVIYLDNEPVSLTDEQASSVKQYLKQADKYNEEAGAVRKGKEYYQEYLDRKKLQDQNKERLREELSKLEKPEEPDFLENLIDGRYWNGRVYGQKKGSYAIYLDREKVSLTDDQAADINEYQSAMEEYLQKKKELKEKFAGKSE